MRALLHRCNSEFWHFIGVIHPARGRYDTFGGTFRVSNGVFYQNLIFYFFGDNFSVYVYLANFCKNEKDGIWEFVTISALSWKKK